MKLSTLNGRAAFRAAVAMSAASVLVCGCRGIMLATTPNLFLMGGEKPFDAVPPALQGNTIELIYATDRKPEGEKKGSVVYGIGRSPDLYFGTCDVSIDGDISWDNLVRQSMSRLRPLPLTLRIESVKKCGEFRTLGAGDIARDAHGEERVKEADKKAIAELHDLLKSRLAITPCKRVYIFIHGYANEFPNSVFTTAQIWHFLGRQGVPIAYSWPAGHSGFVRGYSYDRESGSSRSTI